MYKYLQIYNIILIKKNYDLIAFGDVTLTDW